MKKLFYEGPGGFLEGVGYVKPGDEVSLDAERAKALLKSQPEQWSDRAAPDKKRAESAEPSAPTAHKTSFRKKIIEKKDGGKE